MRKHMYVTIEHVINKDIERLDTIEQNIFELLNSKECKRNLVKDSKEWLSTCNDCKYFFDKSCLLSKSLNNIDDLRESLQHVISVNNMIEIIDDNNREEILSRPRPYRFKKEI